MSSRPTFTKKQLKVMSDEDLAAHWSGWKRDTGDWFLTEMEVKRRQTAANEMRGWVALVLSVAALALSIVSLYFKNKP